MVGWLGGCCCNQTDPPPGDLCSGNYLEAFTDDFSPTFDPLWEDVTGLVTDAGTCRATGQWNPSFPGITNGSATARFQKVTVAGKSEATVKLVDWQELPLLPGNSYQVLITLNTIGILPYFSGLPLLTTLAVAAYRTSTVNQYVFNDALGTIHYTGIIPQDGDTFGIRLSNHALVPADPSRVAPGKAELLVNGVAVWSTTAPTQLGNYLTCDFRWNLVIWQVAFPAGVPFPGQSILRLDDFAAVCE